MKHLCGNCERIYDDEDPNVPIEPFEIWIEEEKRKIIVPVRVCPFCGSPEHSRAPGNQWEKRFHLVDIVKLKEGSVSVSTINLMTERDGYFFETMIFGSEELQLENYIERYRTKEEAIKRHKEIVQLLKSGRYKLKPSIYTLILQKIPEELPWHQKMILKALRYLPPKSLTGEVYRKYAELVRKEGYTPLTIRRVSSLLKELANLGLIECKLVSLGRCGRSKLISLKFEEKTKKGEIVEPNSFI